MKRIAVPLVLFLVWLALTWLLDDKLLRPMCEECSKLFSLEAKLSFTGGIQGNTERISLLLLVVLPWLIYAFFCLPYRSMGAWKSWKLALQKWCQPISYFLGAVFLGLFIENVLYVPIREHLWTFLQSYIERFQVTFYPIFPGWKSIELPIHGAGLAGLVYGLYVFLQKSWDLPSTYG